MKFLSTLIALVLFFQTSQSYAQGVAAKDISYSFNKLRYLVESGRIVNSDQLQHEADMMVSDLMAAGVSAAQIMEQIKLNIPDAQKRADFEALMKSMNTQQLSEHEMLSKISQFFNAQGAQGASFIGFGPEFAVLGLVLLGAIAAITILSCYQAANRGGGCVIFI